LEKAKQDAIKKRVFELLQNGTMLSEDALVSKVVKRQDYITINRYIHAPRYRMRRPFGPKHTNRAFISLRFSDDAVIDTIKNMTSSGLIKMHTIKVQHLNPQSPIEKVQYDKEKIKDALIEVQQQWKKAGFMNPSALNDDYIHFLQNDAYSINPLELGQKIEKKNYITLTDKGKCQLGTLKAGNIYLNGVKTRSIDAATRKKITIL
jgi:hypothetical protein